TPCREYDSRKNVIAARFTAARITADRAGSGPGHRGNAVKTRRADGGDARHRDAGRRPGNDLALEKSLASGDRQLSGNSKAESVPMASALAAGPYRAGKGDAYPALTGGGGQWATKGDREARMRVLVAEDEQLLADTIAEGLRRRSMAVDVCYDGDVAL